MHSAPAATATRVWSRRELVIFGVPHGAESLPGALGPLVAAGRTLAVHVFALVSKLLAVESVELVARPLAPTDRALVRGVEVVHWLMMHPPT